MKRSLQFNLCFDSIVGLNSVGGFNSVGRFNSVIGFSYWIQLLGPAQPAVTVGAGVVTEVESSSEIRTGGHS